MRERNLIFILLALGISTVSAQAQTRLEKHIDVFRTADSIKNELYSSKIDTVLFLYRSWAYDPVINRDGNKEDFACFIIWISQRKLYYQRISEYAIYEVKIDYLKDSSLGYLFRFYDFMQAEIERDKIDFKPLLSSDKNMTISQLSKSGDFTLFEYRFGAKGRLQYWYNIPVSFDDSSIAYFLLNGMLLNWVRLIEIEFKNAMNKPWRPLGIKLNQIENELDFIDGFRNELNRQEKLRNEYTKLHDFESQEILIPADFRGLFIFVQNQLCGQKLKIKNKVRTITIPSNGILLLDKNYVDYYRELFHEKDLKKTNFYKIDKNKRTLVNVLERIDSNLEIFGVYNVGLIDKKIDGKTYELTAMFIGTYGELKEIIHDDEFISDKRLAEALSNCK